MKPSPTAPPHTSTPDAVLVDADLVDQARPGHGVPSQDPDPEAQVPLEPREAQQEAKSTLMGGGMVAGMATGAAVGVSVAGPVGIVVGATVGAVAGVLGGAAAGAAMPSEEPSGAQTAPADTMRLHIEDSGGGGRPVVLIHGWPLSSQAWAPQAAALQAAG